MSRLSPSGEGVMIWAPSRLTAYVSFSVSSVMALRPSGEVSVTGLADAA
jgi:hypothetical protein